MIETRGTPKESLKTPAPLPSSEKPRLLAKPVLLVLDALSSVRQRFRSEHRPIIPDQELSVIEQSVPEATHGKSFEEQFKNIQKKNGLESVDISPPNAEGNPVIYSLGWTGMIEGCEPFFRDFYESENPKRVLSVQYPTTKPDNNSEEMKEGFSEYGLRNAKAVVEMVKQKGLTNVDMVGHSEGVSVSLIAAALLAQEGIKVDNIGLVNPSGFGELSLLQMLKSTGGFVSQEAKRGVTDWKMLKLNFGMISSLVKYVARHPSTGLAEGMNVAVVDMAKLLQPLFEQGTKFSILQASDDPLVKIEDVNGEVQVMLQKARQEHERNLRQEVSQGLVSLEEVDARRANQKSNESDFLIVTVPKEEKPGHLMHGLMQKGNKRTYVPIVTKMLDHLAGKPLRPAA